MYDFFLKILEFLTIFVSISNPTYSTVNPVSTNHFILITQEFGAGSYFGYSSVLFAPTKKTSNAWIILSAPKGDSVENYESIKQPGVIWRCSLGKKEEICHVLDIDPIEAIVDGKICAKQKCRTERRDENWFGMTLTKNSERFVVCAPKWKRSFKPENYKLNGLCYFLSNELLTTMSMSTTETDIGILDYTTQRLVPLGNQSLQVVGRFPVYSWGQAGFSAHLTSVGNELLIGAPGVNGWNGSVIRYRDNLPENCTGYVERQNRGNESGSSEFAQFGILRTETLRLYEDIEYFGYSVTSGRYFKPIYGTTPTHMFVAGAPRSSELLGKVFIFEFLEELEEFWFPHQLLRGDQLGSYFGSVLVTVDINGDELDDLLVGAPFYTRSKVTPNGNGNGNGNEEPNGRNSTSSDEAYGDEGCVYVYTSKGIGRLFGPAEIICGSSSPGARFGSTIAALGDINNDGFQDFAVGAAYEEESKGAVYIYYGKASFGQNPSRRKPITFVLKIRPSDVGLRLVFGFGSSITGQVDIDNNGTPDFAVGAFQSDKVAIFRTRRLVEFETKIEVFVNGTSTEKLKHTVREFVIQTCAQVSNNSIASAILYERSTSNRFNLKLQLRLNGNGYEILESLDAIEEIHNSSIKGNGTLVDFTMEVDHENAACKEWTIERMLDDDEEEEMEDSYPKPLKISLSVTYEEDVHKMKVRRNYLIGSSVTNGKVHPFLYISGPEFDDFCPYCPAPVTSEIEVTIPIATDNCDADGDPKCKPDLSLSMYIQREDSVESDQNLKTVGYKDLPVLTLVIELSNAPDAETAYFPVVELTWLPDWLSFSHFEPYCTVNSSYNGLRCGFGDFMHRNESISIALGFESEGFYALNRSSTLEIFGSAYPDKDQSTEKKFQQLQLLVTADSDATLTASPEFATFTTFTEPFTPFTQTYRIKLEGETPVELLRVVVWFPVKYLLDDDKTPQQLLYVTEPMGSSCSVATEGEDFSYPGKTNLARRKIRTTPDELFSTIQEVTSLFGNLSLDIDANAHTKTITKDISLNFKCENEDDENCIAVDCEFPKLLPDTTQDINFPLFIDSDFMSRVMKTNRKPVFHVHSIAKIRIFEDTPWKWATANTYFTDYSIQATLSPSLWVYAGSGLAGAGLLTALTYFLVKRGFFKRARRQKKKDEEAFKDLEKTGKWEYSEIYEPKNH